MQVEHGCILYKMLNQNQMPPLSRNVRGEIVSTVGCNLYLSCTLNCKENEEAVVLISDDLNDAIAATDVPLVSAK